jgi:hypothetical protein
MSCACCRTSRVRHFSREVSFVAGAAAAMFGGYLANGGVLAQPTGEHIVQAPFVVTDAQGRAEKPHPGPERSWWPTRRERHGP